MGQKPRYELALAILAVRFRARPSKFSHVNCNNCLVDFAQHCQEQVQMPEKDGASALWLGHPDKLQVCSGISQRQYLYLFNFVWSPQVLKGWTSDPQNVSGDTDEE